ncbi:hypothetical protein CO683_27020 [Bradyrhizobium ottawaense]|uniref:hypothetical protein n=1 Tax=Bradyrhizobium ottawaense TaxID=931866 RepID=UPI000BE9B4B5|nr:hypothetical protein [Bradyrhizobium ottawaense]PDT66394.1 hypothetical protein CO683_27020 [Bradyrhizobium ottawaense]
MSIFARAALYAALGVCAFPLAVTSGASAQPQPSIRGNFKKIAVCVYRALDPLSPGNFRMTDLGDAVEITFETSGGGMTFRGMKATFTKVSETVTTIDVEGPPPGYYPSKVRPLANECATKR